MKRSAPTLGVITIGQTPRPDLVEPLRRIENTCNVELRGALDGLDDEALDTILTFQSASADATYPLETTMSSGRRIVVEERALAPLVQARVDELDQIGVSLHLLLCAGPFSDITSSSPIIRPAGLGATMLSQFGHGRILVVVPINDQILPAIAKWTNAGFAPEGVSLDGVSGRDAIVNRVSSAYNKTGTPRPTAIVFDYVGYPGDILSRMRKVADVPIVDLGELAIAATESVLLAGELRSDDTTH